MYKRVGVILGFWLGGLGVGVVLGFWHGDFRWLFGQLYFERLFTAIACAIVGFGIGRVVDNILWKRLTVRLAAAAKRKVEAKFPPEKDDSHKAI